MRRTFFAELASLIALQLAHSSANAQISDIDQDGIDDVLVREPTVQGDPSLGRVTVVSGADASVLHVLEGPEEYSLFGYSAVMIGDLDGDGDGELAISAPMAFLETNRAGRVYIYDGGTYALRAVLAAESSTYLTWNVANAGDCDGDGVGDVVVMALELQADGVLEDAWRMFSGATGEIIGSGLEPSVMWGMSALPPALVSVPKPTADVNGDKQVNMEDAVLISQWMGLIVPPASPGDVVVSGTIDYEDFIAVMGQQGQLIDPVTGEGGEPAPINPNEPIPTLGEAYHTIVCKTIVIRPGSSGIQFLGDDNPQYRGGDGNAYEVLVCTGGGEDPCIAEADFDYLQYDPDAFGGDTKTITFVGGGPTAWEIVEGEDLLASWTANGPQFTYTTLQLPDDGRLTVRAPFIDGECPGVLTATIDIWGCAEVIAVGPQYVFFGDTETYSFIGNPPGGQVTWSVLSGGVHLDSWQQVGDDLLLTAGGIRGIVTVRATYVAPQNPPCTASVTRVLQVLPGPSDGDSDGDGVSDGCEDLFGSDATDPLDWPDPNQDTDGDGLPDVEECMLGTDPFFFDSDGDGIPDGDEVDNGSDPNDDDTDGDGIPDSEEDCDGDGLSDFDEIVYGTEPCDADSDDDGTDDGDEVDQGSDPNDDSDNGEPPDPNDIVNVQLTIGDHSGSHSERWAMEVGPISLRAPGYGEVITRTFTFRRGASYDVTIRHLGTNLSTPDYDYHAQVSPSDSSRALVLDPDGMLGYHTESSTNYAQGREAYLYIPTLQAEIIEQDDPTSSQWLDVSAYTSSGLLLYGGSEPSTSDNLRVSLQPDPPAGASGEIQITWSIDGDGAEQYTAPSPGTLEWDLEDIQPAAGAFTIEAGANGTALALSLYVEIGIRTDDVIVIGWIDASLVTLASTNVAQAIVTRLPESGPVTAPELALFFLIQLGDGEMTVPDISMAPMSLRDRDYVLDWMFKHAGNADPNTVIPGGDFRSPSGDYLDEAEVSAFLGTGTNYKMFNRAQVKYAITPGGATFGVGPATLQSDTRIGITSNPLPLPPATFPGQTAYLDGRNGASMGGTYYYHINDGSPDQGAIQVFNNLMAKDLPPGSTAKYWENIGTQIRFRADGDPLGEIIAQPYPTYHVYRNGTFMPNETFVQAASPAEHFYAIPHPFGLDACGGLPAGRCGDAVSAPHTSAPLRPYITGPSIP